MIVRRKDEILVWYSYTGSWWDN